MYERNSTLICQLPNDRLLLWITATKTPCLAGQMWAKSVVWLGRNSVRWQKDQDLPSSTCLRLPKLSLRNLSLLHPKADPKLRANLFNPFKVFHTLGIANKCQLNFWVYYEEEIHQVSRRYILISLHSLRWHTALKDTFWWYFQISLDSHILWRLKWDKHSTASIWLNTIFIGDTLCQSVKADSFFIFILSNWY